MKIIIFGLILAHSWYPTECCFERHCHPVPCDEISEDTNGSLHWKNLYFDGSQIKPSRDKDCHVCHQLENNKPVTPICIFIHQSA